MPNPELATPTLWLPDRSKSYVIFGFTGQGQQSPEMFMDWYEYSPETDELLKHFHDVTETQYGEPLDPEELNSGPLMQPSNIALEVVGLTALKALGIEPNETFGHSLGELGAVACSGCVDKIDIITLSRRRGECTAMNIQELIDSGILTGMAAISKKAGNVYEELKETLSKLGISPKELGISNINTDDQVVVSGLIKYIETLQESLGKGTRSLKLAVDGAYHSLHMVLAKRALQPYVDNLAIKKPGYPKIYSPTSVGELKTRDDIATMLTRQLIASVRYEELIASRIAYLNQSKISRILQKGGAKEVLFVEIGPYPEGKPNDNGVLIGLNRKNVAKYQDGPMPIRYHRVSRPEDLQAVA